MVESFDCPHSNFVADILSKKMYAIGTHNIPSAIHAYVVD